MGRNDPQDYTIVANWMVKGEGWKQEETLLSGHNMYEAWEEASTIATKLDQEYGDDHFWNVNLNSPQGAIVQLFHGRLK